MLAWHQKKDRHPKKDSRREDNTAGKVLYLVSGPKELTSFSVNFPNVSKQALENLVIKSEWFRCGSRSPVTATAKEWKFDLTKHTQVTESSQRNMNKNNIP